ncbi:MAG: HD domain-containing protein [Candidatus Omnitrophota bacterium]|nr:HD domain-containing protein [Candidatus Omnitrophota bacterium]
MVEKLDTDIYFTPREAAKRLNLSLSTIKNYIYANKLKTLKTPGGHHRISKNELLAAMGEKAGLSPKIESPCVSMENYCAALVNVFKLLGPHGNSFIIHSRNVAEISHKLSKALGFKEEDVLYAKMAGLVHDIGHVAIDRRTLAKQEPLTLQEYELIKLHPSKGGELLNSVKDLKDIAIIVAQHHERMDGTGYPKGISEKDIKKIARVISIAEAYDAMVSEYSYKKSMPKEEAISELAQNKGLQFDGDMVEVFIQLI